MPNDKLYLAQLDELRSKANSLEQSQTEAQMLVGKLKGQKEALDEKLKDEFGITTVKDAQKLIEQLNEEIELRFQQIREALEEAGVS